MKKPILFAAAFALMGGYASAQTATAPKLTAAAPAATASAPMFVKGDMNIAFNTKQNPPGTKGIMDVYNININVANSVIFHGKMTDTPQIIGGMFTKSVIQPRSLNYDVACDVVNPANPAQTKNIGRMYGAVPISSDGVYNYDAGDLVIDILPLGNAAGFTSKFSGTAAGKPLVRPANWSDTIREAVNITRLVNGKPSTVTLKRYDKMDFHNVVLAQGPVQIYQPVTLNGTMLYDYDKSCWFFNNFTVQYADGQNVKIDHVTGTMRWEEDPQRKTNGLGQYEFDIRVNEPVSDGSAAFAAPSDESSFFASDTTIPGLVGTMKYKDTLNADGDTTASAVAIDLTGNNINKQQVMVLAKVIIFASVIPMNSD